MSDEKWTTKFSKILKTCENTFVVYWIHSKYHKDYESEGYVGVTSNLYNRLASHISNCKKDSKDYLKDMKAVVNSGEFQLSIIYQGDEDSCYAKELLLRSERNTGWNRRSGGRHFRDNIPKHIYNNYTSIVSNVKKMGLQLSSEWSGFNGADNFNTFYEANVDGKDVEIFLPKTGVVGESTVIVKRKKDFIYDVHKKLDFFGDGNLISNTEIASLLGIKPNTLATQRKRGWSNGKIFLKAWFRKSEDLYC